jgi:proteasome lid subunit RPN8/RPN11
MRPLPDFLTKRASEELFERERESDPDLSLWDECVRACEEFALYHSPPGSLLRLLELLLVINSSICSDADWTWCSYNGFAQEPLLRGH